jgi:drug/metabolite transporter (DMT)-like permease
MSLSSDHLRGLAVRRLFMATFFWGLSFPVMRALGLLQAEVAPGGDSWTMTAAATFARFGTAALLVAAVCWRDVARMTWLEVYQGGGLGLFGGVGILFQMDGLAYTSASTSAFLTQSYCVLLPVCVAARDRRRPGPRIWASCVMVLAGVAVLGRFSPLHFRLGRGEGETLLGALIFTGQILWLERPLFRMNKASNFSVAMFLAMALVCSTLAGRPGSLRDWGAIYGSGRFWIFASVLIGPCTASYLVMNKWQPFIPATEAGLIYGFEPLWASLFALFVPGLISRSTGLAYENETATWTLVLGGGLITGANFLVQLAGRPDPALARPGLETGQS